MSSFKIYQGALGVSFRLNGITQKDRTSSRLETGGGEKLISI